jgi:hypothetical protein
MAVRARLRIIGVRRKDRSLIIKRLKGPLIHFHDDIDYEHSAVEMRSEMFLEESSLFG